MELNKHDAIRGSDYHKQGNRMCQTGCDARGIIYKKNKKFMAEISSSRDQALRKLMYIMNTTEDESVAAACAKTILIKLIRLYRKRSSQNALMLLQFNINLAPKPVDISTQG